MSSGVGFPVSTFACILCPFFLYFPALFTLGVLTTVAFSGGESNSTEECDSQKIESTVLAATSVSGIILLFLFYFGCLRPMTVACSARQTLNGCETCLALFCSLVLPLAQFAILVTFLKIYQEPEIDECERADDPVFDDANAFLPALFYLTVGPWALLLGIIVFLALFACCCGEGANDCECNGDCQLG